MSCYWLEVPPITGEPSPPREGEIAIIGSGLAGVSSAYWLQQFGFKDLVLMDHEPEQAASFRNCGHILHGTVESMKALCELHGEETAREIWDFSVSICEQVKASVLKLGLSCDYRQDGYLVMAIDEAERGEVEDSVALLNRFGFANRYVGADELRQLGFLEVCGGRYEPGSACAHPTKFRNGVLEAALAGGLSYHSGTRVKEVEEDQGRVRVVTDKASYFYDAVVLATNAYSPKVSSYFSSRRQIEPFKGQIIVSEPLSKPLPVTYPHSFDHGYEYALGTPDGRLMIGGWRQNIKGQEIGSYSLDVNEELTKGLKEFVARHYGLKHLHFPYAWTGVMAASQTGFPFIGPTSSPQIFTVSGFTGHGFSWAHGSAKLLAQIMAGQAIPKVARFFKP